MKVKLKSRYLTILMSLAMLLAMVPMLTQPAHAKQSDIELAGGSYTLTADNYLVNDENSDDVANIHTSQRVFFHGDTVINLNGYELNCNSIKSAFNNPNSSANQHPFYTYDLTIDGGDQGGSIRIGSIAVDDYTLAANNLTIKNLDEDSNVLCLWTSGNKIAIFALEDLKIEGIKKDLQIYGSRGIETYRGTIKISDVSGNLAIDGTRCGIKAGDSIEISRSKVSADSDFWMESSIQAGTRKGISITDSYVVAIHGNDSDLEENSTGGYNAFWADGTVEIKDSFFVAVNGQKDRPAMIVANPGKLIVSGKSIVGSENYEGASVSPLMAADIELRDGNRLFQPRDGYIGTVTYNNKSYKGVLNKDGSATDVVLLGSGKELVHTIAAPSKVFTDRPIHMSGILKDEDGNPVPNIQIEISCDNNYTTEYVTTDARGMWKYEGDSFEFADPGEVTFEIYVNTFSNEEMSLQDMLLYLPLGGEDLNVQVVSEGQVETLEGLELSDPPEGKNRKTEYKCGERFDLNAAYIKAIIKAENAAGESAEEELDLDPSKTTVSPATLKHGTDTVSISYSFEGRTASIDYPVTVEHDWKEASCTAAKTCKGCGEAEGMAPGHKWGAWKKLNASQHQRACTHDGSHVQKANHTWDKGKVTKKATITSTGVRTYTCTTCKATKTAKIAKLPKKANTLKIKAKTATVKYSTLRKKTLGLSVSKVIGITKKGQGKLTYAKAAGNKKITINKKTGKVTVKKGLKKGNYRVKVKVKAAGNANYNASAWKIVTFIIKVK